MVTQDLEGVEGWEKLMTFAVLAFYLVLVNTHAWIFSAGFLYIYLPATK